MQRKKGQALGRAICPQLSIIGEGKQLAIRYCTEKLQRYGCRVIDLYSYYIPYDTIDGSHPNAAGMEMLAKLVISSIK